MLLHPREKVWIIPHDQLWVERPPLDPLDILPLGVREADETAHQGRDRLSEAPAFGALVQTQHGRQLFVQFGLAEG